MPNDSNLTFLLCDLLHRGIDNGFFVVLQYLLEPFKVLNLIGIGCRGWRFVELREITYELLGVYMHVVILHVITSQFVNVHRQDVLSIMADQVFETLYPQRVYSVLAYWALAHTLGDHFVYLTVRCEG